MKFTRRHLLATSGALAAAGAIGAGGLALRWWDRPPGAGFAALSLDEHAFVDAIAEAWMPEGGEPSLSGRQAKCGDFFDATLAAMPRQQAKLLKLLLQVLDDTTLVTHGAAFRHLDQAAREAVLHGWIHHDQHLLRGAVQALMILLGVGYTTHPDVAAALQPNFTCWYGR